MTARRAFSLQIAPAVLYLLAFFIVPLGVLLAFSFGRSTFVSLEFGLYPDSYVDALNSSLFMRVLGRSIWIGVLTSLITLLVSLPLAYAITLGPLRRHGRAILFLVIISLFSAYIVRVYAWRTLLGQNGALNSLFSAIGIVEEPIEFLLYNKFSLVLTYINILIPLAVLPLFSSLSSIDRQLLEASRTLGASWFKMLREITLPLASRGILAAFVLCFVVAAGDYVTPQLVGGPSGILLGNIIVARFGIAFDWPLGSALAFLLIFAMGIVILITIILMRSLRIADRPR